MGGVFSNDRVRAVGDNSYIPLCMATAMLGGVSLTCYMTLDTFKWLLSKLI